RRTDAQHTPYAGGTSPFQNACYELGFEGLMQSMLLEPELVHRATAKYLPKPSPRHEAMKRAGVGTIYLFQMFGGGDLFGPKQFEEFVAPVVKIALDFYHERGFRVVYYPMGNATPHLEPMRDLDWDALSLEESRRDYVIDIGRVREVMGPDRVLFGNVPTAMIETGTEAELIREARRQFTQAAAHGNFILSCGTPIAPGIPADRVKLFCELPERI
ncbi:MAG TPA: uroporphyrinogen decarboxylase family protein, partial [Planctomycetota bacterium]|nr:uroporphyrinogen decarboxylase family protein [Planctomycetota bacterium]